MIYLVQLASPLKKKQNYHGPFLRRESRRRRRRRARGSNVEGSTAVGKAEASELADVSSSGAVVAPKEDGSSPRRGPEVHGQNDGRLQRQRVRLRDRAGVRPPDQMMDVCNARGFVYGIVPESGRPITGNDGRLQRQRVRLRDRAGVRPPDHRLLAGPEDGRGPMRPERCGRTRTASFHTAGGPPTSRTPSSILAGPEDGRGPMRPERCGRTRTASFTPPEALRRAGDRAPDSGTIP
ncbi:uncharacterized protein A4U43_C03F1770 [Asparagus officinalis]|uniref:Ethylene insensitive 3-like DNA-binding domain-containing protein n=1 Tax=Asparagus officinalis TaxID=4686 RepID=A0A5P1FBJ2_ASPOF|nr:uncharacterized protein A4U43_C03F1770 [Asparagus officinalis]